MAPSLLRVASVSYLVRHIGGGHLATRGARQKSLLDPNRTVATVRFAAVKI
jgi:hypothetical protein